MKYYVVGHLLYKSYAYNVSNNLDYCTIRLSLKDILAYYEKSREFAFIAVVDSLML
jgi:hypothetical protein